MHVAPQIPASPASAGTHCLRRSRLRPLPLVPVRFQDRLPRKRFRRFRLRLHLRALIAFGGRGCGRSLWCLFAFRIDSHASGSADSGFACICGHSSQMDSDDAESDQTESQSHECPQTESAEPLDSGVEGLRGVWTPAQAVPQIPASPASAGTRDKRTSEHQRSPPQRRPLNRGDRYSARSNIAAARSSVSSSNAFDWSCSPIGSFFPPSSAKPALMEMPGIPAMFVFTV